MINVLARGLARVRNEPALSSKLRVYCVSLIFPRLDSFSARLRAVRAVGLQAYDEVHCLIREKEESLPVWGEDVIYQFRVCHGRQCFRDDIF